MKDKSLVGSVLSLAFCLIGYIAYVNGVTEQNTVMILMAALIYFLPLFIEFCEELEGMRIGNPKILWTMIGCMGVGTLYLVALFAFLVVFKGEFTDPLPWTMRFLMIILPIVCLPIKAYPLCVKILQLVNRNQGTM